ncbi:nucleoside/nucleotide kinase family protein [Mycolicibacterium farcinogenes]|uniref:Nucleoside/nucleotide kinase family protein n=1 Tax=Mycolicibacterium farcinogenes TaxID=1802 RepID=A0ACD1FLW3_MYCFR|nr:nucleoside/nucleotide kinase family protein [Mycolicibacterium farcinogenes]QZH68049.1 nucleoside/nucleotide kinase family protein [Mycolicibacterium farcinogenes]
MCTFDDLLARVLARAADSGTSVIGITGAPGAGKSTLTEALVAAARLRLGADAVAHVPMDGFHLADVELRRLGRLERKGAPDTFDVAGYAALLRRIRARTELVYAPCFERDIEQPVAGAIPVSPDVAVVLTEGNYLLLDDSAWVAVAGEIDEIWYCAIQDDPRIARLVARHMAFGKSADAARRWVAEVDEPNARMVAATAVRADLVVSIDAVLPNSY